MTMRCSASPSTALYWPQVKTLTIPFLNSIIDVLLVVGYKHTVSRMISCTKLLLYCIHYVFSNTEYLIAVCSIVIRTYFKLQ